MDWWWRIVNELIWWIFFLVWNCVWLFWVSDWLWCLFVGFVLCCGGGIVVCWFCDMSFLFLCVLYGLGIFYVGVLEWDVFKWFLVCVFIEWIRSILIIFVCCCWCFCFFDVDWMLDVFCYYCFMVFVDFFVCVLFSYF